jgi:hypothetical protein
MCWSTGTEIILSPLVLGKCLLYFCILRVNSWFWIRITTNNMRYYKCHDQNFVINHCVNVSTIVIANTHFSNRSHRVNFQPTINFNLLLLWCKARCWSFHHTSIDNCYIIYVITSFLVVIITNYTLPVFHHQSLGHTSFFVITVGITCNPSWNTSGLHCQFILSSSSIHFLIHFMAGYEKFKLCD